MRIKNYKTLVGVALFAAIGTTFIFAQPVLAADGDVVKTQEFIKSVIKLAAGFAGLIAAGFFVVGGFGYITSTGHPEHLDKAKTTLKNSSIGLAIVIGAFIISNIITDLATKAFGS
ncbi:MAG: hypothetical protein ACREGD_04820 [Candidatus Saccharimonadales bacterium]